MFTYLFPIFCFGLVITGIVFLGIMEASRQAKGESANGLKPATRDDFPNGIRSRHGLTNGKPSRFSPRRLHE